MARSGNYQRPWEAPYQSPSRGGYFSRGNNLYPSPVPVPVPTTTQSGYTTTNQGHDAYHPESSENYDHYGGPQMSQQDHYDPHSPQSHLHNAEPQSPAAQIAAAYNYQHTAHPSLNETRKRRTTKEWSSTIRKLWVVIVLLALIILVLAIVLPVYFLVIRPGSTTAASAGSGEGAGADANTSGGVPTPTPAGETPERLTTGGDGSEITMENGTTFRYSNTFGGFWYHDPADPFNLSARPNSWTPPLNTTWRWGTDRVFGVNLGGLFVLEPFINPGVFQRYPGAVDEWTLTQLMREDGANGGPGLRVLEEHYETFITERDIAQIAGSGLNWLRVPIGYWALETYEGEPFLEGVSWRHFLRVVEWARKYGLRVFLDLHAVPGSQNGMNHSARRGQVNLLAGNMGIANAQRLLYYIRKNTEI